MSIVVDFADVEELEVLEEVFPDNEENSIFVLIPL